MLLKLLLGSMLITAIKGRGDPFAVYDRVVLSDASTCRDSNDQCLMWAAKGECQTNPAFMLTHCRQSCNNCEGCADNNPTQCHIWSKNGDCKTNMVYMYVYCKESCRMC